MTSHRVADATTTPHTAHTHTQEEFIKDEMKNLKRELIRAKEEIKRIQSVPLVIGQFNEIIDANYGIVGQFYVYRLYVSHMPITTDSSIKRCATQRNATRWFLSSSVQSMG